jgi:hypothetical protein
MTTESRTLAGYLTTLEIGVSFYITLYFPHFTLLYKIVLLNKITTKSIYLYCLCISPDLLKRFQHSSTFIWGNENEKINHSANFHANFFISLWNCGG